MSKADEEFVLLEEGTEKDVVITQISDVQEYVHDKFGKKKYVELTIEFEGMKSNLRLFLPDQRLLNPASTVGKLLKSCKCTKISELIGKKTKVKFTKDGYLKLNI